MTSRHREATWKLAAVCAALILWLNVAWEQNGLETIEAGVRYVAVPGGMEVNPDEATPVSVTLRGGVRELARLRSEGLLIEVDCGDAYTAGPHTYTIQAASLRPETSAEFVKATPSQIRYALDERQTRAIDIVPEFSSGPEDGYLVEGYSVHPAQLRVVGPAERVGMIEAAATDPIDLSDTIANASFRSTAFLADPYLRFDEDPSVTIYVRVRKR